jgi:hypothetical protein
MACIADTYEQIIMSESNNRDISGVVAVDCKIGGMIYRLYESWLVDQFLNSHLVVTHSTLMAHVGQHIA